MEDEFQNHGESINEPVQETEESNLPSLDIEERKKRIVHRQPQPKLNPARILGPRGIGTLESLFENFQFRGKGHEFEDLNKMMKIYEHWAHRLYPKLPFKDVMDRIATLGKKKEVQVNVKKIRLGMKTTFDTRIVEENDEDDVIMDEDEAFERLIQEAEIRDDGDLYHDTMGQSKEGNQSKSPESPESNQRLQRYDSNSDEESNHDVQSDRHQTKETNAVTRNEFLTNEQLKKYDSSSDEETIIERRDQSSNNEQPRSHSSSSDEERNKEDFDKQEIGIKTKKRPRIIDSSDEDES